LMLCCHWSSYCQTGSKPESLVTRIFHWLSPFQN